MYACMHVCMYACMYLCMFEPYIQIFPNRSDVDCGAISPTADGGSTATVLVIFAMSLGSFLKIELVVELPDMR